MIILIYILDTFLFGSTWVAIKIGLESLPPFTGAVIRNLIAFVLMFVAFRLWRFRFPPLRNVRPNLFLAGLAMYGFSMGLIYLGQQQIAASMTAILYSTLPFFTALIARYMIPGERLTLQTIIGLIIGFLGTIVLFSRDLSFSGSLPGMIAIILSSVFCAWATVKTKHNLHDIDARALATLQILPGMVVLVPCMFLMESTSQIHLDAKGIGALLYLAILGTGVAFVLWYYLLKHISPVALALMTFLEPLVAAFLAYFLLGETLDARFILGGILILIGVLTVTLRKKEIETKIS